MKELFTGTGLFTSFDLHFAQFMCNLSRTFDPQLFLAAALTTRSFRDGHVCCNLEEFAQKPVHSVKGQIMLPPLDEWLGCLLKSGIIGRPGSYCPLILENTKLYLYRYWKYEQDLANILLSRAKDKIRIDVNEFAVYLKSLFDSPSESGINWQKTAAAVSLLNQYTVISGGPGTGKTTTVAKILALLNMSSQKNLRIALAAPTGKAAARLSSSIQSIIPKLPVPADIQKRIPCEAHTIHRLLGAIPNSPDFRHNASAPLPYDIVLVDEASMIDLALMAKLVSAVPQKSRIIMLGDRDQLSSVEAGAVIGDICDTGNIHKFTKAQSDILKNLYPEYNETGNELEPLISDSIVTLRKSYRFSEDSGIGKLSRAVIQGDINKVTDIMNSSSYTDCKKKALPSINSLRYELRGKVLEYFVPLISEKDPGSALSKLDTFKILCAARQGPFGVTAINNTIISILKSSGLISGEENIFRGLPILINTNDYALDLYNGDNGIIMPDLENNKELRVAFKSTGSNIRMIHPRQLRSWEAAYSTTVHKSQGSEFDHVLLVLPPVPIPVLTRELLYTALTRARKSVEIWCTDAILQKTVSARVIRYSGLRDKLWGSTIPFTK